MDLRQRLVIAQPAGLANTLARAAQAAGAFALVDLTQRGGEAQLEGLTAERLVVRVTTDAPARADAALAILAPWTLEAADVTGVREAIAAWHSAGVQVAVEVRDRSEGRRAKEAGADLLVARGAEGPGRVSTRSNLVLLPALAALGLPLVAWGGAGPNATAALLVHAELVVFDAQLYGLPEAGLSEPWRKALERFDGTDVRTLGTGIEEPCNIFARIADKHVHKLWETSEAATGEGPRARRARLQAALEEGQVGWDGKPGEGLLPIGSDASHASYFTRFSSLEDALGFLDEQVPRQLAHFPLTEGSPLAQDHGTRYPIVQGAMANVSEVPAFAKAVADAGALPFLAFAALREEWAREAVDGTMAIIGDQPWGCGIIGLDLNAKKRDAHVRIIKEKRPPFALVAAGTAEQARDLEKAGVQTYLHTPAPGVLAQALSENIDRAILEGAECGGHIGKLPSLVLWDLGLQVAEPHEGTKLLFAGGISGEASAAMAGVLAAGVPHVHVGLLMGTAYLATREIVETGAITADYQQLVLAARRTAVTGETVGIRARSAPTPFTERVTKLERELLAKGLPVRERKEQLEHENLGATRIAARGLKRGEDGSYGTISPEEQFADGNYLMGQAAELLEERITLAELHERVTTRAAARAERAASRLDAAKPPLAAQQPRPPADEGRMDRAVAVVGLGCVLPDAPDVASFWQNLLDAKVSIRELPKGRWPIDGRTHLHEGPDGTYTLLGGFIETTDFDPLAYRIPPKVADQMDETQKWAVLATDQALRDAGLTDVKDRARWAVVLGNALGGEHRAWTDRRMALREAMATLDASDLADDAKAQARASFERQLDALPTITEDTMPGELSNVVAGRVCHVFDIGGPARTVDAACASSLAALEDAVGLLRDGAVDVAISGGVDRSMDPAAYAKFSAIGALSREGSFPFDERASGFVMGEGCAILVLKRLSDAVAEGDRVYAVIEGVASSSDGKGKGITAPNPAGQERAVRSALADAGWDAGTLTFVEAHGTGTPVGDPAEAATLESILGGAAKPGQVALGSVKANIGHLKAAAGAAGLLKTALAIHHGVLPPAVVEKPTSKVDWTTSPLRLPRQQEPWIDPLRRAGVSAFGFGGTNSHVLMAAPTTASSERPATATAASGNELPLTLVSAQDKASLAEQLDRPRDAWRFEPDAPVRMAIAKGASLDDARAVLDGKLPPPLALGKGVAFVEGAPGKLAIVFPGQGSQYAGMVLDLAEHFPAAREVLAEADEVLAPLVGKRLSDVLALEGDEGDAALQPTEICQPAVLTCDIAIFRILEELGVRPDLVAGHSLGEYAALVAGGVLTFRDALLAVSARGREMANVHVDDPGGLVALKAGADAIAPLIEGIDAWPANLNAPDQTVVAGTTAGLEELARRAEKAGLQAARLPVSAAFHSPIVAPATEPLRRVLDRLAFDAPTIPVLANVTAAPYPKDPDAARDLLAKQVASPVRWVETMAAIADAGTTLVVEAGPKRVLTNLSLACQEGIDAVPTAHPRTGAKATFEMATLALGAHGRLAPVAPAPRAPAAPARPTRRTRPGRTPVRTTEARAPAAAAHPTIVVSGVSLGLPGTTDPFAPGGDQALLRGENRITAVSDALKARMTHLGITRLVKDNGTPRLEPVRSTDDVVQLAGRLGDVSLADYDADPDWLGHADVTAKLAVAAALEALTDAHIPLVRETRTTSTGATLEDGWVLPEPLQARTGVILASAFAGYDSFARELTRHGLQQGSPVDALLDAVTSLTPHLDDPAARTALLDWVTRHHVQGAVPAASTNGASEPFPRDFLFKALALGHAQVAQLLRARGPNLHVNAACASTTAALALAQDWIRLGRCDRVVVLGVDVAGNDALLPWIGAGFLAAGAATTAKRVEEAALPFDQRRHGMLIGSGAVALVVERAEDAAERGVTPLAELVATHVANSAYHGARLEPDHVADQVTTFLKDASRELGLSTQALAKDLVFVSHEPATPARGGSAEAEVRALRSALGESARDVLITNTKGLTGHAMGAGLEDAIAVRVLQHKRAPPVANLRDVDPAFEDLTFSRGGLTERGHVLRFAAGFGSQVAMALFKRVAGQPGAVDQTRFNDWVTRVAGGTTTREKRLLRVQRQAAPAAQAVDTAPTAATSAPAEGAATPAPVAQPAATSTDLVALLTELVAERTGYPLDVIDPAMDLEGDLGVDTVKQAEVIAAARERLGIGPIEGLSLADVPTIEKAAAVLASHLGEHDAPSDAASAPATTTAAATTGGTDLIALLTELVAERTGYPLDVIDPAMDLEGDLGVDTVKQAEVIAAARERLGIGPIEGLSLADVPTIEKAAAVLRQHLSDDAASAASPEAAPAAPLAAQRPVPAQPVPAQPIPVLALSATEAIPAPVVARSVRVLDTGPRPEGLDTALQALDATLREDAELWLAPVPSCEPSAEPLVEFLTSLQEAPPGTRLVLLGAASSWATAGLPALAGTLTEEGWPARAVLVDDATLEDVAREVLRETDQSVALSDGRRFRQALAPAPRPADIELADDAVVLATGGLGAAVWPCLVALAQGKKLRLAIVGRGPAEANGLDPDDEAAVKALRDTLFAEARSAGEVKPAAIEQAVQAAIKQARRAQAIAALGEVAEVRYDQCDATDADALIALVDDVRTAWGEPSLVVHGAGADRSRAFADKTADELSLVLRAKLDPAAVLTEALPEAHHVAFGSIAGVTGNAGQADYALANGALNALIGRVGGTVIHWTAWEAAGGMADKDSIRTVLAERGVRYLPVDDGAAIFAARALDPGAFVVADLDADTPVIATDAGARVQLEGNEPWLQDHTISGRPLLPGVRHLECMVETAYAHGLDTASLAQARFLSGLWVTKPTEATVALDGDTATLARDGKTFSTVRFEASETRAFEAPALDGATTWDGERIYAKLFHGPRFQVLTTAEADRKGARASARLDTGGGAWWAMALEACMQAAGLSELEAGGNGALPVAIERVHIGATPNGAAATVHARLVARELTGSVWDAQVVVDDEVVLACEGVRLDRMEGATDLVGLLDRLEVGSGARVRLAKLTPHDPREPKAKRAAQGEAGERAAKDALRSVHGREVAIERDEDGRPYPVETPGSVSITHSRGLALAAAHPDAEGIGIDLEAIEPRNASWREASFSADELAHLDGHTLGIDAGTTVLWTLKEAASKAIGTGLTIPLEELQVAKFGDGTALVVTPHGEVEAWWVADDRVAVSVARRVD